MAKAGKKIPTMVVQSKVKEYLADKGFRSSSDVVDSLSAQVAGILDSAAERCKANGRSTVRGSDL